MKRIHWHCDETYNKKLRAPHSNDSRAGSVPFLLSSFMRPQNQVDSIYFSNRPPSTHTSTELLAYGLQATVLVYLYKPCLHFRNEIKRILLFATSNQFAQVYGVRTLACPATRKATLWATCSADRALDRPPAGRHGNRCALPPVASPLMAPFGWPTAIKRFHSIELPGLLNL